MRTIQCYKVIMTDWRRLSVGILLSDNELSDKDGALALNHCSRLPYKRYSWVTVEQEKFSRFESK